MKPKYGTVIEITDKLQTEYRRRDCPPLDRDTRREIALACHLPANAHAICGRWGTLRGTGDLRRWV
jgi:hypothetical protein